MAIIDRGRLIDGSTTMEGGMDSGRSPSMLQRNQCAYAGNITFRGGYPTNRPGFKRVPLTGGSTFEGALFQGAGFYSDTTNSSLVAVANGLTYTITPPSSGIAWTVTDITTGNGNANTLSNTRERCHMVQADEYLIIQDGTTNPFIWDGSASDRSAGVAGDEVPVGTGPMAYGNGRLWVATTARKYVAGDIVGGSTGVLKFTENTYLNGGGSFSVAAGSGSITSMVFTAAPNTALGHGELLVMTTDAVTSVQVPTDRYDWYATQDPLQRVLLVNNGSASQFSTELVNGDAYFRSRDGIRSVVQAVRDFSQTGNTPISREMSRILKYDADKWLPYASGVLFDNRYLMTSLASPHATRGIGFKGLVALDFDLISGLTGKSPMAYDGFWEMEPGLEILQIVKAEFDSVERCFIFARNSSGDTELWEVAKQGDEYRDTDYTYNGGTSAWDPTYHKVSCELEYPSFDFEQPAAAKELEAADLWVDELTGGTTEFHMDFHPDEYPCWVNWQDWSITAETTSDECQSFVDNQRQYRPRMRIGRPPDTEEPATGKRFNYGWTFSARLKWTGHARVKMIRMNAREVQEEPYQFVEIDSTSKSISCDCLGGVSNSTNQ